MRSLPFPRTQVSDLTLLDRVQLAWRDLRYGRQHAVFNGVPPGHYYSPIPALDEVAERDTVIFSERELPGIELRGEEQLALARELAPLIAALPFEKHAGAGRYRLDNSFFQNADGLALGGLMSLWRPKRVVEVGSGYSTAALLDTVDSLPGWTPDITCIEPYPQRLKQRLRQGDDITIIEQRVQQVPLETFLALEAGDVLVIDSTHVSKIDSDVNYLLLDVVPRLAAGVHVHVHDVYYPFEYPREWVYGGSAWNEAYLVRALLTHSSRLQIAWWSSYLDKAYGDTLRELVPRWDAEASSSIWLTTRA